MIKIRKVIFVIVVVLSIDFKKHTGLSPSSQISAKQEFFYNDQGIDENEGESHYSPCGVDDIKDLRLDSQLLSKSSCVVRSPTKFGQKSFFM